MSLSRADVERIIAEAREVGSRPDLSRADLSGADLSRAYLSRADLTWADLYGAFLIRANLSGADLTGADLAWADLTGANLTGANLTGANLTGADLTWANLYGANLTGANLAGANLTGADLYGANLSGVTGGILAVAGLPSGGAYFVPLPSGWRLTVGCWDGTVDQLRTMIAGTNWPEARGEEQDLRRPGLLALADLCDAHAAAHADSLAAVTERWAS